MSFYINCLFICLYFIIFHISMFPFKTAQPDSYPRKHDKNLYHYYKYGHIYRDFNKIHNYMGRSPNYGRNSNIFHITNGLNSLHRKWYTGNQYMVKSAENRMRSNLEGCRTFRNLVVSYLDRDVSYWSKNV